MRLKVQKAARAGRLTGRAILRCKQLAGTLLVGTVLLGVTLAGCKPSTDKAAKPSGTNAVAARPQAVTKANPAPGPMPRTLVRTNQLAIARPPVRSNAVPLALRPPPGRTNALAVGPRSGVRTNAAAAAPSAAAKAGSGIAGKLRQLRASPYFYPAATVAVLCVVFGVIFLVQSLKAKSRKAGETLPAEAAPKLAARPVTKKARRAPIHSCNVLQVAADARHLWQFGSRGRGFVLSREQTSLGAEPLPAKAISKDWRNLWQRKLNIAWLPPEQVFLRVAQFPVSDFEETLAMVELQLEKLSPMPVAQVVWSIQILPHAEGNLQTVIVMIAGRNAVEEFLGKLEGQGYMADRLEMPRLDQLRATTVTKEGAWIYPDPASASPTALVAWWYGGVLQNLALIMLPPTNRPASLKEQLLQMAWAGELEGWLTATPSWHLVADPTVAAQWEPDLREALEQPVEVTAPPAPAALAAMTAQRVAQTEPQANLLPVEFSTRYQQQFVDRLWFRGLVTVLGLYLLYVLVFFGRLELAVRSVQAVENQVAALGPTYTNALQLKARYQILKDREELKYAALDCWKAVAEWMPEGLTLDGWNFSDGQKLVLNGTAGADQVREVNDFEAKLRKAPLKDQFLFNQNKADDFSEHQNPGGTTVNWSFSLELNRTEAP